MKTGTNAAVVWRPQPRQMEFMRRPEPEALYGGAAGGGKSDALVIEALRQVEIPHYRALILRKTFPQLSDLVDKSQLYYRRAFPEAQYNATSHVWVFPSGAKIYFGSMQHTKDRTNYQGKAFDFIGFDELTHFEWGEYSYMMSRNRPSGDALTPGLISVLTCVLDVIFNFCLINPTREMVVFGRTMTVWGLGWGVPGAALGTALATAISGVLTLAILLLRDGPLCIRKPGSWHITKACLQNLWKVGAPLAAERAVLSSAQVLLIRIVSGLGTTAIAANSLGVSAESLCYMAGYGIQDASLALVGQAVGANRRDMAKNFAWLCTGMGIGIMALTGVGMYIFAPNLMGIFTADAAVIALGAQVLRIEALAEPMFGASIVASGAMQGAGDSTGCFVLNLVSMWGIRLTLAVLLAPRFGLTGVWTAMCVELCTRGVLFLLRLARGKWLEKGALS